MCMYRSVRGDSRRDPLPHDLDSGAGIGLQLLGRRRGMDRAERVPWGTWRYAGWRGHCWGLVWHVVSPYAAVRMTPLTPVLFLLFLFFLLIVITLPVVILCRVVSPR